MPPLVAATLALAGVALAFTHDVLLAQDVAPSPRGWTPAEALVQIVAWSLVLLAIAVELRRQAARRLDTYRESRRG